MVVGPSSVPGEAGASPQPGPGPGQEPLPGPVLLHGLHREAALQQVLHAPGAHLRWASLSIKLSSECALEDRQMDNKHNQQ